MEDRVLIGYEATGRFTIPIYAPAEAVRYNPEYLKQRVEPVYNAFTAEWGDASAKEALLEDILADIQVLDASYPEVRRVLRGHFGCVSNALKTIQVDSEYGGLPGVVEHELLHLLGMKQRGRPVVRNAHLAANILLSYCDDKDLMGYHTLGTAGKTDYILFKAFRYVPALLQDMLPCVRKVCCRIGNSMREEQKSLEDIAGLCG